MAAVSRSPASTSPPAAPARAPRTPRPARQPAATASALPAADLTTADDAWGPWMTLAERSMSHWQQWLTQLQDHGQHTLQALTQDMQLESETAETINQPTDLLTLQATLAAETSGRLMAWTEQSYAAWLTFQNQCWQDLEAMMARALQPWHDHVGTFSASSAGALICPPETTTPGALMGAATQAWPVATQAVLNAIEHDLQAATPTGSTTQH